MNIWNQVAPGPTYYASLGHILDPGFHQSQDVEIAFHHYGALRFANGVL